jgi:hypothetical protein
MDDPAIFDDFLTNTLNVEPPRVRNEFIDSKEIAALRYKATAPALVEYQREKYKWSQTVFDEIDWPAYDSYTKRLPYERRAHVVKLIHSWQNVGTQRAMISEDNSNARCPFGCGQSETPMHYIHCKRRPKFSNGQVDDTITGLYKWLSTANTAPPILQVLRTIIPRWIQDEKEDYVIDFPENDLHDLLRKAIESQRRIGWDHFFQGKISIYWGRAQQQWYSEIEEYEELQKFHTKKIWTRKLVAHLVHHTLSRWQERNAILHDMEEEQKYVEERSRLLEKTKELLQEGFNHPNPEVKRIFMKKYEELSCRDNGFLTKWTDVAVDALAWAQTTGQQRITTYFTTT